MGKKVIKAKYGQDAVNVGDEGGFAPNTQSSNDALDMIMEAVKNAGYEDKIVLGTDAAASEFCNKNKELTEFKYDLNKWVKKEDDKKEEDDWKGWNAFNKMLGDKIQIVGDDLLVTNPT